MTPDANNCTFLIKSFLRRACVERLILSIRKFYPSTPIVVVDDSTKPGEEPWSFDKVSHGVRTINLPFDSGLSAGRNAGVRSITTETFCLLDDDFVFTDSTRIELFRKIMDEGGFDIVAGIMREGNRLRGYYGKFKVIEPGKIIECVRLPDSTGPNTHAPADIVPNFFLAKTESVRRNPWDDSLKMGEHTAFFYDAHGKLSIAYTDRVVVDHKPYGSSTYQPYRTRAKSYYRKFLKDRKIKAFRSLAGTWSFWDAKGNSQSSKAYPFVKNPSMSPQKALQQRINPLAAYSHPRTPAAPPVVPKKPRRTTSINTKNAIDNLTLLHRVLREEGVVHWLTDGTLLGAYREGKIIAHDRDTDLGVSLKTFTPKALRKVEAAGFRVGRVFGRFNDGFEIAVHRQGVKTDLFFFYDACPRSPEHTYHSAYASFTKADCQQFDFLYRPFGLGKIELAGFQFPAPDDVPAYLSQKYGPDFMTPVVSWNYWKDPKNTVPTKSRVAFADSEADLEAFRAGKLTLR